MTQIQNMSDAVQDLDDSLSEGLEEIDPTDFAIADPTADYRQPWDRLDNESEYAWQLFIHYRNSGPKRSQRNTARFGLDNGISSKGSKQNTSFTQYRNSVSRFVDRNRWNERCFSYDADQERLYQLARSEAIRDMAVRHEIQIEKAIDGLMTPIDALNKAIDNDPEFMADLSKTDKKKLISLANLAARTIPSLMAAERLSRGMPTEIVSGMVEHQHITSVGRDQIGEVLAVLGQAGVINVALPDSGTGDIIDAEVVEVHPVPAESD